MAVDSQNDFVSAIQRGHLFLPLTQRSHTMNTVIDTPDFAAIKQRQQATWASGDYAVIGTTLGSAEQRVIQ